MVDRVVEQIGATHVIHLPHPCPRAVHADLVVGAETIVIGSLRVLDAARRKATQMKWVVYASSAAASCDRGYPDNQYGVYKACGEGAAQRYWKDYGVASVGLRPCVVYGPGRESGASGGWISRYVRSREESRARLRSAVSSTCSTWEMWRRRS